jgi:hypothetical protein
LAVDGNHWGFVQAVQELNSCCRHVFFDIFVVIRKEGRDMGRGGKVRTGKAQQKRRDEAERAKK